MKAGQLQFCSYFTWRRASVKMVLQELICIIIFFNFVKMYLWMRINPGSQFNKLVFHILKIILCQVLFTFSNQVFLFCYSYIALEKNVAIKIYFNKCEYQTLLDELICAKFDFNWFIRNQEVLRFIDFAVTYRHGNKVLPLNNSNLNVLLLKLNIMKLNAKLSWNWFIDSGEEEKKMWRICRRLLKKKLIDRCYFPQPNTSHQEINSKKVCLKESKLKKRTSFSRQLTFPTIQSENTDRMLCLVLLYRVISLLSHSSVTPD